MWSKLAWDVDCFRGIQTSYPDEREPLAYAAINVCIAAASLQHWVKEFLRRAAIEVGTPWDEAKFFQDVISAVPEQSACVAIANTSKHSEFQQRKWRNGEVLLTYEEGDEHVPSGYVLYHLIADSHSEGFALSKFDALCQNWLDFLASRGLTNGHCRTPEWMNNKLNRILRPHGNSGDNSGDTNSGDTILNS